MHVVTGKGGTGKSTVAAALAVGLAAQGCKVLLCEVEGRQGIAQIFDVAPLPYEERQVAALDDGAVYALAIDAEEALLEYLAMFYRLGRAGKALDRFGVIDFATTIAPGVRDVLLTGKVYEAVRRRDDDGDPVYDAVVLDAPPTGRIARFLNVNAEVAGLAKVGPIHRQADSIMTLMRSRRTRVHLVTLLEEMPVQETLDAVDELTAAELRIGTLIVNQVHPAVFDDDEIERISNGGLTAASVRRTLRSAGLDLDGGQAQALLDEGRERIERMRLQAAQRALLDDAGAPVVELPAVSEGIDLAQLLSLGETLAEALP
ncbi:anion-transporting ArsA/GET3 family ATPase [Mumia flava]|uniref:Anion-transporting ArsA/GET3 family ATPase n=2 Tax=Mumia flava TaxID=1348852 RepID=A0A0B2BEI7_9ACTN|nr:ArsA-related P-loop ATPase [Mumia flava]PJJ57400.1 anion-transporting ArsA/GET3 family ATPase [Mumia flava]